MFEYAVSGLPVICSNLVAMKEMVSIYKCGISIPPNDLKAFIEAFNTINKNENDFKICTNLQKELLWENQNKQLVELKTVTHQWINAMCGSRMNFFKHHEETKTLKCF